MQHRKARSPPTNTEDANERAIKKLKVLTEVSLPVQPERTVLLPFWVNTHMPALAAQASCSLGTWCKHQEGSVSLVHRSSRPCDDEDEDTQDTACSSCCESEDGVQQIAGYSIPPPMKAPKSSAAAPGEEDSITSHQHSPAPAGAAFSFGSRPCLTPDLSAVYCWDIIHGLLEQSKAAA